MPYNWNNYNKPKKKTRNDRPDHQPGHRMEFERNRKRILATQEICALCGKPVDKKLKYPHPMCATVDHIIPVSKGGHPSAIDNLQLAHFSCNRQKWDRVQAEVQTDKLRAQGGADVYSANDPRGLPWSIDWSRYEPADENGRGGNFDKLWEEAEAIRAKGYILTARGIMPKG